MRCRSVLLICSSVLGTEVTQPDRSSVTSVLDQFGPQKKGPKWPRTEVTKDRSGCRVGWQHDRLVVARFSLSPAKFRKKMSLFRLLAPCRTGRRKPKNPLDAFIRLDRTPTCDGGHRHKTTAITALTRRRAVKTLKKIKTKKTFKTW